SSRPGLVHAEPLQLCDATQEPPARPYVPHPGDGDRSHRPHLELLGVYLAARACRPNPDNADGRTNDAIIDSGTPAAQRSSTDEVPAWGDARSGRSRSGEGCLRGSLLFSRTTQKTLAHTKLLFERWLMN